MRFDAPLISIVLTTYNSERVVEKTLKGIIEQDFSLEKVELIVVDGGSKDNTLKIINEFVEYHVKLFYDAKVIIHDRNYGVSKARNDGIKMSGGRYILVLDHDVIMPRDTLAKLLQYLESADKKVVAIIPLHNSTCRSTIGSWEYIIRRGKIWRVNAITSCALVRRELFDEIGFYDETLGPPYTIYEDIELGARALSKGYEIHLLGTLEVVHETCDEASSEAPTTTTMQGNIINKVKVLLRYIRVLKGVMNPRYRYALVKYLRSAPITENIRWCTYIALAIPFIPIMILMFMGMFMPLYIWILASAVVYFDAVHQYWNGKVPYISLAYAFIAYVWRLIRSLALVLPVNASRHLRFATGRS
jgi:glycosyltransferase involved in cell wall biosynthesis